MISIDVVVLDQHGLGLETAGQKVERFGRRLGRRGSTGELSLDALPTLGREL
jgi:hypothetical protein